MMNFSPNINELSIESVYGSIKDPWVVFPFAAPPLRSILVTVHNRPTSTGNRKADDEYAAGRKAVPHHYQTVHTASYEEE